MSTLALQVLASKAATPSRYRRPTYTVWVAWLTSKSLKAHADRDRRRLAAGAARKIGAVAGALLIIDMVFVG